MNTQVLIVGAGPVGLTLVIDLGRRGVRCILLEQKDAPQFLPKMERCNARTMEIYRRMGLAHKVRDAGFPREAPMDVFIVTSLIEPPFLHLPYPSVSQAQTEIAACNDGSMPLEPYQLISQYTLEPLLKSVAETIPSVSLRYGCEFLALTQDTTSVRADVKLSTAVPRISRRTIWSVATAAQAPCVTSSASSCGAKPTCWNYARRSIAATTSMSAFRSARAATITSPTRTTLS